MPKLAVLNRIIDTGLVAIIRADVADHAARIAEACAKGGVEVLEITFTVPGAAKVIEALTKEYQSDMVVGAGTVLDPETARIAILSGARFVVSPALNPDTARLCNRYQVPHMPGTGTVKEIIAAMELGAEIIKVFPSEGLGPGFVKAVRSPLPQAQLMPTGGVSLDNVTDWIQAGCIAVGVSGHLTGNKTASDSKAITETARQFLTKIKKARG
ncbi:MAG TPA: bifunctional 2-keto-4-hydroxyglutarate aldolase/2-keto-3-deoxy-6-phosphogluconate aldolase [Terriglobia bacterium]|nr:bifunctional 2-keto-4-hydroxyglutarate aldolase/2-keto-3-deoxy-6-phosphogluconate aldolase [Terriglobia bacterium]